MPRRLFPLLVLAVLVAGCSRPTDQDGGHDTETDRAAQTLALAISYPRQADAAGWARAAEQTNGGQSGEIVLLAADDLTDVTARLVFLVHRPETNDAFGTQPAVNACYRALFNRYGATGRPDRITCPADSAPLQVPPAPPTPRIPTGSDVVVTDLLRDVTRQPDAAALRTSLLARLGSPAPDVDVRVVGTDVGIAIHAGDACLLGSRTSDVVRVYSPPRVTVLPGENACDATTALGPPLLPPH